MSDAAGAWWWRTPPSMVVERASGTRPCAFGAWRDKEGRRLCAKSG
uniref:Uncharacterized protein n=1 Tax=Rhizophora mucronata TaxID=61149 RepID=A0A2P2JBQ3_RHIMU